MSNSAEKILHTGKLPHDVLRRTIESYSLVKDERVVEGAKVGRDVAVIEFPDRFGVFKVDPITFATDQLGYYAVTVPANDIYTSGADPLYYLPTLLLPKGRTTEEMVITIFQQIGETAEGLGVVVLGGHTEVTYGIDRPIVAGSMYGEVAKEKFIGREKSQPGDHVILAGGAAIEATSLIAREKVEELLQKGYSDEFICNAKNFLFIPGISVAKAAKVARDFPVRRMHDPTEGGLGAGLWEVAEDAAVGIHIDQEQIFLHPESVALCQEYDIDPLGVISSGGLIIVVPSENSNALVETLNHQRVNASIIGEIKERDFGLKISSRTHGTHNLPHSAIDEITKILNEKTNVKKSN